MLAARTVTKSPIADPSQPDLLSILLKIHPYPLPLPLEATDNAGNTPLHHASAWGNLKAIRTLLELGADPGARNEWSWTPVAYSASVQAEVYFRGLVNSSNREVVGRNGEILALPPSKERGPSGGGTGRERGGSGGTVGRERGGSGGQGRSGRSGSDGDAIGGPVGGGGSPITRARGPSVSKGAVRVVRSDSLGQDAVTSIEGLPKPEGRIRQAMLEAEIERATGHS